MNYVILSDLVFFIVLLSLAVPLGLYIYKIMSGKQVFLTRVISPLERGVYKIMRVNPTEEMSAKKYAASLLVFSFIGLLFLFVLQLAQAILPLNPENMGAPSWHLAFNTAASFVSNSNWQAYPGESTLSYITQALGMTVQNFVSAAAGIAVLFALIRGFTNKEKKTLGNFWADLVRTTLYVLIPLALIASLVLVSQGVIQSLAPYTEVAQLQSGAAQTIPAGPAASQIAIKQIGTNGGGFFGANSAYPLENPTQLSNFIQLLSILLIPVSLCFAFGRAVKKKSQGIAIFAAMGIILLICLVFVTVSEYSLAPEFAGVAQSGNMEGKEVIHGVGSSALWGVSTTAASNGSVNSMHDSFTPLGGMALMLLMQLGEVVFGGAGSGLSGMIAFALLTVFIAGLMVGRTPEFLGKKIVPFDMKMVCLILLTPPLLTLLGTAAAVSMPQAQSWLTNSGAHGFSELLYGFTSIAGNNGSAFAGLNANTVFTNITGGLVMLAARFIPQVAALHLAGSLSSKRIVAAGDGTLSTSNATFTFLLICVVLIVGALSFLPALALGPIADFFTAR